MKHPSQDDLLGYVLGALDAQQQRDLQQRIDSDPELEEQLLDIKASLVPLDYVDAPVGVRPGLARRACELVASVQKDGSLADVRPSASRGLVDSILVQAQGSRSERSQPAATMSPISYERGTHSRSWSLTDVMIGIAACAVLAGVLLPAISYSRHMNEVAGCQNNLRVLGQAFQAYSEINDGYYVKIPENCKYMGVSGIYAPVLKEAGLIDGDSRFACPGVDTPVSIPRSDEIRKSKGMRLVNYQRNMGGHYGYSLGYMDDESIRQSPRNLNRSFVIVLADQPSGTLAGRRSRNHRDSGQNCLFEDGRVEFVTGHAYGEDSIYFNEYGIVGPGCRAGDNVIAPSNLSPLLPMSSVNRE